MNRDKELARALIAARNLLDRALVMAHHGSDCECDGCFGLRDELSALLGDEPDGYCAPDRSLSRSFVEGLARLDERRTGAPAFEREDARPSENFDLLHGYQVVRSRDLSLRERVRRSRIVLVDRGDRERPAGLPRFQRYVTALHYYGDAEWTWGHYYSDFERASDEFDRRVERGF